MKVITYTGIWFTASITTESSLHQVFKRGIYFKKISEICKEILNPEIIYFIHDETKPISNYITMKNNWNLKERTVKGE